MPGHFKVGDKVRVVGTPNDLPNTFGFKTREVFMRAVGKTFQVEGFNEIGWLELFVGKPRGYLSSIWIEPEFVERVRMKV